jgi:hypothetical protein
MKPRGTPLALVIVAVVAIACSHSTEQGPVGYRTGVGEVTVSGGMSLSMPVNQAMGNAAAHWPEGKKNSVFELRLTSKDGMTLLLASVTIRGSGEYTGFDESGPDFIAFEHLDCTEGACRTHSFDSHSYSDGCKLTLTQLTAEEGDGSLTCKALGARCSAETSELRSDPGLCERTESERTIELLASFRLQDGQEGAAIDAIQYSDFPPRKPPQSASGEFIPLTDGEAALEIDSSPSVSTKLDPQSNWASSSYFDATGKDLDRLEAFFRSADGATSLALTLEHSGAGIYRGQNAVSLLLGIGCEGGEGKLLESGCRWYNSGFSRGDCSIEIIVATKATIEGSLDCRSVGPNCQLGRDRSGICMGPERLEPIDVRADFVLHK